MKVEASSSQGSLPANDGIPTTSDDGRVQLLVKRKRGKKRGRPRKIQTETGTVAEPVNSANDVPDSVPASSACIHTTSDDGEGRPPAKRRRGRPPKVRSETKMVPEPAQSSDHLLPKSADEGPQTQDDGSAPTTHSVSELGSGEAGTVGVPPQQPMTLCLSPPPMPPGKVPQPAGVLLLPLYCSTPTDQGDQSSLMIVQPHQLGAKFPFPVGGQYLAGSSEPGTSVLPILAATQPGVTALDPDALVTDGGVPVINPLVTSATVSQPAVIMLPSTNAGSSQPT